MSEAEPTKCPRCGTEYTGESECWPPQPPGSMIGWADRVCGIDGVRWAIYSDGSIIDK